MSESYIPTACVPTIPGGGVAPTVSYARLTLNTPTDLGAFDNLTSEAWFSLFDVDDVDSILLQEPDGDIPGGATIMNAVGLWNVTVRLTIGAVDSPDGPVTVTLAADGQGVSTQPDNAFGALLLTTSFSVYSTLAEPLGVLSLAENTVGTYTLATAEIEFQLVSFG